MTSTFVAHDHLVETRRSGIGGSDIHHVFNLAPYGCARQLAYEKRGVSPDHPFHGNRATQRGQTFEDFATQIYAEQTGRQVRRVAGGLTGEAKRDSEYPFMLVHSDREIVNDSRGPGLLSVKVPGAMMFQKIKYEGLPNAYTLQLQYEMAIWRRVWGSYAIFWLDEYQLLDPQDIERDDALVDEIRTGVTQFWKNVIEDMDAPLPPKHSAKDPRCGRCPFRTRCQGQELVALMGKGEVGLDIPYDHSLAELIDLRNEHQELFDQAETLLDETNAKIKLAMGERQAVDTDGARIYYRVQKGRTTFQADKFSKAYLQLHPELTDEFTEVVGKFTNTGAPFRSLRVYPK